MEQVQESSDVQRLLQQALERKAEKENLTQQIVTGKVRYDRCSKKLGVELYVAGTDHSFHGAAEVQVQEEEEEGQEKEESDCGNLVGQLESEHPICASEDQAFELIATHHIFFLAFKNQHALPDKWLLASPVPGLGPLSAHAAGKWT